MAESDSGSEQLCFKISEYKCAKCKKKVKNGVQCNQCDTNFHFKCGSVSGIPGELKWNCPCCEDKSSPLSLFEVRFQELERAYLLKLGECNTYAKLYDEINIKYMDLKQELHTLKSTEPKITVSQTSSRDTNKKIGNVLINQVENNFVQQQVSESDLSKASYSAVIKSNPVVTNMNLRAGTEKAGQGVFTNDNVNKQSSDGEMSKSENITTNNEEFVMVKKRKYRKPIIGTGNSSTHDLSASVQMKWLHVYRLQEETSVEQIMDYLKKKCPNDKFTCDKLQARGAYASFKIGYGINLQETITNCEFWPEGVAVRPFLTLRDKPPKNT